MYYTYCCYNTCSFFSAETYFLSHISFLIHSWFYIILMQNTQELYGEHTHIFYVKESMSDAFMSWVILAADAPCNLNMPSITDISVEVVSKPQNALQSFTTKPAPITSLPLFTVPATKGTCSRDDNSSRSSRVVRGWTCKSQKSTVSKRTWNKLINEKNTYHAALICKLAIAAHQRISRYCLLEYFNAKHIRDDVFRLSIDIGMNQSHVVVRCNAVS